MENHREESSEIKDKGCSELLPTATTLENVSNFEIKSDQIYFIPTPSKLEKA